MNLGLVYFDGFLGADFCLRFDKVIATEASAPMARQLRRRGFSVLGSADLAGLEAGADGVKDRRILVAGRGREAISLADLARLVC